MQDEKEIGLWQAALIVVVGCAIWFWMDNDTDGTCTPKVTKEQPCIDVMAGDVTRKVCFDLEKK